MSMESALQPVIAAVVPSCYPDIAPTGTSAPYAVYQQVGGPVINPVGNESPGLYGARVQVIVWAATRLQASSLMQAIEAGVRTTLSGRPVGALIARYDEHAELRGAMQDFTFWHTD